MLDHDFTAQSPHEQPTPSRRPAPRRDRHWWEPHYRAWVRSGLTHATYCAEHGLNPHTFDNWCAKFRREARAVERASSGGSKFVAVELQAPSVCTGVTLSLGEVSLRFDGAVSADELQPWVRMLRTATC